MNNVEYQKLYELETTYWWHVGRRYILETLIKKYAAPQQENQTRILDVGCGTGENLRFLGEFGEVKGIDNSPEAIRFSRKRGFERVQLGRAEELPFPASTFDLITMLDLLEHLKDDSQALKEAYRVLKAGGSLLVTVPAWPSLWSEHDEALHHKRRYSKRDFTSRITEAGFVIKKLSFAITTLFPLIYTWRLFQKIFVKNKIPKTSYIILPQWLNSTFIKLLQLEAAALNHVNLPFGVSLVCVAQKKSDGQT